MRERRFEMDALICYEAGKTWPEADADTAETIEARLDAPEGHPGSAKLVKSAGA